MEGAPAQVVRDLAALDGSQEEHFGGKSATLGEMIGAGIAVPPGFAVATAAFDELIAAAGLERRVEATVDGLDPNDVGALAAAAEALAEALAEAPLPAATREAIEAAYGELAASCGEPDPPVAVRSSARGEDSEEATFAGQQETFLWVRGAAAVCEAVRGCWASLFSAPAISYRARMKAGGEAPAMGVTVQLMVDAAVSGVLFTCSPLSGDPSVIAVDASWGLGLGVVGGEVTPDEFVLSKVTGEVLRRTIGSKHVSYRPPRGGGRPEPVEVEPQLRDVPCLDEEQLSELAALGRRVERHFGGPQDVEWAITASGEVAVLQARPVTVLPGAGAAPAASTGSALSLVMRSFGAGERKAG